MRGIIINRATGNDFIYRDSVSVDSETYEAVSGFVDKEGNKAI